jgi:hypothetical protein
MAGTCWVVSGDSMDGHDPSNTGSYMLGDPVNTCPAWASLGCAPSFPRFPGSKCLGSLVSEPIGSRGWKEDEVHWVWSSYDGLGESLTWHPSDFCLSWWALWHHPLILMLYSAAASDLLTPAVTAVKVTQKAFIGSGQSTSAPVSVHLHTKP